MRLFVSHTCSVAGVSIYALEPILMGLSQATWSFNLKRFQSLAPRIERMCRQELGSVFVGLEYAGTDRLDLKVRVARNSEIGQKFQDVLGWIRLFEDEPKAGKKKATGAAKKKRK